jgi:anti-anti-sigma factor
LREEASYVQCDDVLVGAREGRPLMALSKPSGARPRFRFETIPERDRVRIVPVGEVDLATTPRLAEAIDDLRGSGFDHVVLDLRGVTFIDSTGLRLILELHGVAGTDSLTFELIPGPPAVQRIFEATGTLDRLPFRA